MRTPQEVNPSSETSLLDSTDATAMHHQTTSPTHSAKKSLTGNILNPHPAKTAITTQSAPSPKTTTTATPAAPRGRTHLIPRQGPHDGRPIRERRVVRARRGPHPLRERHRRVVDHAALVARVGADRDLRRVEERGAVQARDVRRGRGVEVQRAQQPAELDVLLLLRAREGRRGW